MKRLLLSLTLLLFVPFLDAKLPELTPKDVRSMVNEVLKAHVSYKELTPELIERILQNYLEELDPMKTYLLHSEIDEWTSSPDSRLQSILEGFKRGDFSAFEDIQEVMVRAIHRRGELEAQIETAALPKGVDADEFKEIAWADSKEELLSRLLKIKALQLEAAEKLSEETQDEFLRRIKKRRINRETEILGDSHKEKEKFILTYVLKATTAALDSHTNYFTPSEASQFMIQVQQRLFGIGAQLRDNLNGFTIVRLLDGGPASMGNKLKINDRVIAVNKEPVVGMDIIEAVELIRGEKGTPVLLTILRETKEEDEKKLDKLDVEIIRGEVVLEETRLETNIEPYADGVIANLRLFSFYQDPKSSSASDIKKAIDQLKAEHNLKGVVLDLRNNSGGLLPQAVAVTGLFITKGIVVSIKDNSGRVQHLRDTDGKITWDGPLVVLTNRASASAAEIVAQTLQDYGRAIVVGDKHSFGKGTFQTFTLDSGNTGKVNPRGEYKVTRGMYYTVSGKSPQLVGVQADIVVPGILSELDIGEEFAKFPLENDAIEPHFEDDLADIPLIHRNQVGRLYKHNLQPILTTYTQYLDILKKNSSKRLEGNKNYQNFLKEIEKKHYDAEPIEIFGQSDLQLIEANNIMKDLVFLRQINETRFE